MEKHVEWLSSVTGGKPTAQQKVSPLGQTRSCGSSLETVRINSFVELQDMQLGTRYKIRIVMPDSVDLKSRWISVFAPLSAALMGHREHEEVRVETDGGRRIKIVSIVNDLQ